VYFDKHSGASITRASQPLGGITSRRNAKDENLIRVRQAFPSFAVHVG
jgi:hypothetical protein